MYNDNLVAGLEPSEEAQMEAFRKVLMQAGYVCTLRHVFLCVGSTCS